MDNTKPLRLINHNAQEVVLIKVLYVYVMPIVMYIHITHSIIPVYKKKYLHRSMKGC